MGCLKMIDRRLMKREKEDEGRMKRRGLRGGERGRKGREDGGRRKREEGRSHDGSCPKGKEERSFCQTRAGKGIT